MTNALVDWQWPKRKQVKYGQNRWVGRWRGRVWEANGRINCKEGGSTEFMVSAGVWGCHLLQDGGEVSPKARRCLSAALLITPASPPPYIRLSTRIEKWIQTPIFDCRTAEETAGNCHSRRFTHFQGSPHTMKRFWDGERWRSDGKIRGVSSGWGGGDRGW